VKIISTSEYQPTSLSRLFDDPISTDLAKGEGPGHRFRGNQWTGGRPEQMALPGMAGLVDPQPEPPVVDLNVARVRYADDPAPHLGSTSWQSHVIPTTKWTDLPADQQKALRPQSKDSPLHTAKPGKDGKEARPKFPSQRTMVNRLVRLALDSIAKKTEPYDGKDRTAYNAGKPFYEDESVGPGDPSVDDKTMLATGKGATIASLARKYDAGFHTVAGMAAALSSNNAWQVTTGSKPNVAVLARMLDTLHRDPTITITDADAMFFSGDYSQGAMDVRNPSRSNKKGNRLEQQRSRGIDTGPKASIAYKDANPNNPDARPMQSVQIKGPDGKPILNDKGKPISMLVETTADKATSYAVPVSDMRKYVGTHLLSELPADVVGRFLNLQLSAFSGAGSTTGWESMSTAVNIYRTGNVDGYLSGQKRRSFYNGFISMGQEGSAVIDRHILRAMLDNPSKSVNYDWITSADLQATYVQSLKDTKPGTKNGWKTAGVYPMLEDTIRQALEKAKAQDSEHFKGMTLHQFQAVVWYSWLADHPKSADDTESDDVSKSDLAALLRYSILAKGDRSGHPFYGNQYVKMRGRKQVAGRQRRKKQRIGSYALERILSEETDTNAPGVTIRIGTGFEPKSGTMASLAETERTLGPEDKVTPQAVRKFINDNKALLSRRGHYLGGWVDEGIIYLDVSKRYTAVEDGIRAGVAHDQWAVARLHGNAKPEFIYLKGDKAPKFRAGVKRALAGGSYDRVSKRSSTASVRFFLNHKQSPERLAAEIQQIAKAA